MNQDMHFDLVVLGILIAFIVYSLMTRAIDRSLLTLPIIFMCLGMRCLSNCAVPRHRMCCMKASGCWPKSRWCWCCFHMRRMCSLRNSSKAGGCHSGCW